MELSAPPPPAIVSQAADQATGLGFSLSCDEPVGWLLTALAAAVRPEGRILELGTGLGVGTAWLAHGVGKRTDVILTTVEIDAERSRLARSGCWPSWIDWRVGDAKVLLPDLGMFDLVFADAEGGKWTGLELTIEALAPGAVLVVDDMDLSRYPESDRRAAVLGVRDTLLADSRLHAAELSAASGIIVATRRRSTDGH